MKEVALIITFLCLCKFGFPIPSHTDLFVSEIDSGLVAYYPFNGNARDESGNGNHGTFFGTNLVPDRSGVPESAVSFNGINSYIQVDTIPASLLGNATKFIGCFINLKSYPTSTTEMGIVYMGQDPAQNFGATHRFGITSRGKIGLNISHGFGFSDSVTVPLNKWIYVFSYAEGTNFYVGVADSGKVVREKLKWTNWGAPQSNLEPGKIWIGKNIANGEGTGSYFNGSIDEVRFYNRILNEPEILEIWNEQKINLNKGLLAWYPFNENANDASSNKKHATIKGTPEYLTGISGKGIRLKGSMKNFGMTDEGDHVLLPEFDFSSTLQFTLSLWVKEDTMTWWHGTAYIFLGDGYSGNASIGHWGDNNNSKSFMGFSSGATNASPTNDPNHPEFFLVQPFDGTKKWVHYASTFKDDTIKAYINGEFVGKKYQKLKIFGTNAGLACHWWDSGKEISTRFTGMMDEVRIYNRALDGMEIDSLHSYFPKSEIKTVKVITLSVTQPPELGFSVSNTETTITKGEWLLLGKNLIINGGSGNFSYKWSPGKSLNDSTLLNPVAFPVDTTNYLLTVTDKNGCSFSVGYKVNVRNISVDAVIFPAHNKLDAILFPNPNDGKFKIKLIGEPTEKIEFSIFNSSGGWIKKQVIRNFSGEQTETFNLNLSGGVYTVRIETEYEVINRQFIIN